MWGCWTKWEEVDMATTDEMMDCLWSVKRFARWLYELDDADEPSKSQINYIGHMCKDGKLPAVKVGKKWRIDVRRILNGGKHGK